MKYQRFLLSCLISTCAVLILSSCNNGQQSIGESKSDSNAVAAKDSSTIAKPMQLKNCSFYSQLANESVRFQFCGNLHNEQCIYSFAKKDLGKWAVDMGQVFFGPEKKKLVFDEKITVENINSIYQLIKTYDNYNPNDSDIAALNMTYGLSNTLDTLKIIYSPLIVKKLVLTNIANGHPAAIQYIYSYKAIDEMNGKKWVVLKNGNSYSLNPVSDEVASRYVNNFRQNIVIVDPSENNQPRGFRNLDNFKTGDIKSTFMSFQQLFWMYCDNFSGTGDNELLTIMPVAGKYKNTGYKLHVVVSKGGLKDDLVAKYSNSSGNDFTQLAADASQMCPPKCETSSGMKNLVDSLKKDFSVNNQ